MKRWERLAAVVFFLVAAGAAVKAFDIGFGTFNEPGPGFFPFWLATAMAAVSVAYFVANLGDGSREALWETGGLRRPMLAGLVMAAFVVALEYLGFATAALLLFAAWLRLVEGAGLAKTALVAVIGAACAWGLFAMLLGLSVPRGLLL